MDSLLSAIMNGRARGESVSDVLTLCYLAALSVSAHEEMEAADSDAEVLPDARVRDDRFRERLERIGKILCPLADDVKHGKREYLEGMIAARLDYAGVTSSDGLQQIWSQRIRALAEQNRLDSVGVAIEHSVYDDLRIRQGMLGA